MDDDWKDWQFPPPYSWRVVIVHTENGRRYETVEIANNADAAYLFAYERRGKNAANVYAEVSCKKIN